ncbi:DUF389 domain-containing protein [Mangrovimonas aestuarii]|uniref:DUF389 domain-containing protein n=1 Tax=Mangrovimonas aestuarii TaxID=3018443 RepID=UPI002378F53F|nr:DUF389 domain-containing protein [Mangrovimonas aestuarii]
MDEHKFNFSEENQEQNNQDQKVEQSKEAVRQQAKGLFANIKQFIKEIMDFRQDTDQQATIEAIKGDIPFKGATAWILICSIFVASIGLNANSTAVVIGAMLISPLMGPILGIGLSVAINDIDTLRKSLINFGVMIFLSVVTAFFFFKFFPLQEESSELLARTKPDIRDVLIAFFGGLALIIARTKKGTIASVIFGVAIATALMPPLCTVGFGLAVAWEDFAKGMRFATGAFYLFIINTIFIALATFLVLKILRFPMLRYANSHRRKRISQLATILAIAAMIPAVWTFIDVLKESNFDRDARAFIDKELSGLKNQFEYIKKNAVYKYSAKEGESYIEFNTYGLEEVPQSTIDLLKSRMKDYPALASARLYFNQSRSEGLDNIKFMEQLRVRDSLDLVEQSEKIKSLEDRVKHLSVFERTSIPFEELTKEVAINYEGIKNLSYSSLITSNFSKIDTIPTITVEWDKSKIKEKEIAKDQDKLERWLKVKLNMDSLVVKRVE